MSMFFLLCWWPMPALCLFFKISVSYTTYTTINQNQETCITSSKLVMQHDVNASNLTGHLPKKNRTVRLKTGHLTTLPALHTCCMELTSTSTFNSFKCNLKTNLFSTAFRFYLIVLFYKTDSCNAPMF